MAYAQAINLLIPAFSYAILEAFGEILLRSGAARRFNKKIAEENAASIYKKDTAFWYSLEIKRFRVSPASAVNIQSIDFLHIFLFQ